MIKIFFFYDFWKSHLVRTVTVSYCVYNDVYILAAGVSFWRWNPNAGAANFMQWDVMSSTWFLPEFLGNHWMKQELMTIDHEYCQSRLIKQYIYISIGFLPWKRNRYFRTVRFTSSTTYYDSIILWTSSSFHTGRARSCSTVCVRNLRSSLILIYMHHALSWFSFSSLWSAI